MAAGVSCVQDRHTSRLVRVMTCGSVDDGKSTLLGRLLFETGSVSTDLVESLARDSTRHLAATGQLDYSLLFDGLEDERQQSITIDVGYRHFSTFQRSYIVADAPGHEQYTRNMATAASNADVAVLLVDARKGLLQQTRRHALICSIFRVPHIIICVNKIDLVSFDQIVFDEIVREFDGFAQTLGFKTVQAIPTSAALGDNVTASSKYASWYGGPPLLEALETIKIGIDRADAPMRFPVQWINRPYDGYRGISGTIASGTIAVGDLIKVLPSNAEAHVSRINHWDGDVNSVSAGQATTILLDRDIDVSRGDLIVQPVDVPAVSDDFTANLLWCSSEKLFAGRRYHAKFAGRTVLATVSELQGRLDISTLTSSSNRSLSMNEIGLCAIKISVPVPIDPYQLHRSTGAFILIDRASRDTVAAGMIVEPSRVKNINWQSSYVSREARARAKSQQPVALWFTGLPGAGKSTIADMVERRLYELGHHTMMIDGDNIRQGINRDLGFSEEDRAENIRRAAEVAKLLVDAGLLVLCCFITPFRSDRKMARDLIGAEHFVEVFVDTPIEECVRRDPKGLYARAKRGEVSNLTGVSAPYEAPDLPDLRISTLNTSPESAAANVLEFLVDHKYI